MLFQDLYAWWDILDLIKNGGLTMSKVFAFVAEGFEETELIAVIDLLLRAKIDLKTVSVTGNNDVKGSHGIVIKTDLLIEDIDIDSADMLFLPGGIPGTPNLFANKKLTDAIVRFEESGKKLAAICAAPSIFGKLNILEGKEAVVYPGFEDELKGAVVSDKKFITSKNISTGKGMGAAIDLGLELIRVLKGSEEADIIAEKICY